MNELSLTEKYDFIDLGSGKGGCARYAVSSLEGQKHLCVEVNPKRAFKLRLAGHDCALADITEVTFPKKSVRFVTMSHILEHLSSVKDVEHVVRSAVNTATDFVFIEGPSFEFNNYLAEKGLKFYWTDWHGHKTAVKIGHLMDLLRHSNVCYCDLLLETPFIVSSEHASVIPLSVDPDQLAYDCQAHPKKPLVQFNQLIYQSFILFVWLKETARNKKYIKSRKRFVHKSLHYLDHKYNTWILCK